MGEHLRVAHAGIPSRYPTQQSNRNQIDGFYDYSKVFLVRLSWCNIDEIYLICFLTQNDLKPVGGRKLTQRIYLQSKDLVYLGVRYFEPSPADNCIYELFESTEKEIFFLNVI